MATKEFLATVYRSMYTIRVFETQGIKLYRDGLIRGYFHPYLGEEAIAAGACAALRPQDYIVSTHRGHGHCIARGAKVNLMVAELLGKETGYCKGRGGSMHIADVAAGNLGANGIVGGGIAMGVGAALGARIRGEDRVSLIFSSDGASANGVFGESLNLAAIWDLPVILLVENNQYAAALPITGSSRSADLSCRGAGYCVESLHIDGNDVLVVHETVRKAAETCRKGKGPVLIDAETYRHSGHHVNDPGLYMPKDKLDYYKNQHDPVLIGRKYMLEKATEAEVKRIEAEVETEMERAIEFARNSPEPSVEQFFAEIRVY